MTGPLVYVVLLCNQFCYCPMSLNMSYIKVPPDDRYIKCYSPWWVVAGVGAFPKTRYSKLHNMLICTCPHEPLLKCEPTGTYSVSQGANSHVNISSTIRLVISAYMALMCFFFFVTFDFIIIFLSINVSLSASRFSSRWQSNNANRTKLFCNTSHWTIE